MGLTAAPGFIGVWLRLKAGSLLLLPVVLHNDVDCTPEDHLTNRLLTAMVALYRAELADLLRQRDAALEQLMESEGREALEAGHAVLASCPIDLDEKISAVCT